jgi:hypothetical protein
MGVAGAGPEDDVISNAEVAMPFGAAKEGQ